ncbi:hypothetical protein [Clostridium omnivorum]|uniref:Uncharacterized protein n=1 Tax=Clostridium omnivorum TaxID=1604902 RepID=A0ABQ5N6J0_9CLOT|nr:hypothetical protein [Clostridium sp. E14]GLC30867.1 hypothetical protein bsdE14_22770 [Clostridium sp. E14]
MNIDNDYFQHLESLEDKEIRKKYKFLGEGISRRVYDLNNGLVLKLAKDREGHYQNRIENYVYTTASEEQKKYLCPILYYSPRIVIMKKAKPLTDTINSKTLDLKTVRNEDRAEDEINALAEEFYLYYDDVIAVNSWGNLDGVNVLIDYGCTSETGDLYYHMLFWLYEVNKSERN